MGSSERYIQTTAEPNNKTLRGYLKIGLLLLLLVGWLFFLLTSPYRIDYFALSPLGVLLFLTTSVGAFIYLLITVRQLKKALFGVKLIFPIFFIVAQQPVIYTPSSWDMLDDSLIMMTNLAAWQSTVDINPSQGIPGYAPLFFRTVVPNYPVTLIEEPNPSTIALQATGLISGPKLLVLTELPPIISTIPNNELRVNTVVFAIPSKINEIQYDQLLASSLQSVCGMDCISETQFRVHPEYAAKLAIDTASLVTTFVKVPRPVSHGLSTLSTVSDLVLHPEWNTAIKTESYGSTTMGGIVYNWYSNSTDVYSGSVKSGNWSIHNSSQVSISQVWDRDITSSPLPNPAAFEQSTFDPPPNTVTPYVFDFLDSGPSSFPTPPTFDPPVLDPPPVIDVPPVIDPPPIINPPAFDPPSFDPPTFDLPGFGP